MSQEVFVLGLFFGIPLVAWWINYRWSWALIIFADMDLHEIYGDDMIIHDPKAAPSWTDAEAAERAQQARRVLEKGRPFKGPGYKASLCREEMRRARRQLKAAEAELKNRAVAGGLSMPSDTSKKSGAVSFPVDTPKKHR